MHRFATLSLFCWLSTKIQIRQDFRPQEKYLRQFLPSPSPLPSLDTLRAHKQGGLSNRSAAFDKRRETAKDLCTLPKKSRNRDSGFLGLYKKTEPPRAITPNQLWFEALGKMVKQIPTAIDNRRVAPTEHWLLACNPPYLITAIRGRSDLLLLSTCCFRRLPKF